MADEAETPERVYHPAFGRFVRRRRKHLDMTQETLAELLGYTDGFISQIERGLRVPDFKAPNFLEQWATALRLNPDEIVAEGELRRYNYFSEEGEHTSGDHALLASVSHLPEDTKRCIARGLREMFPPVAPEDELEAIKRYVRQLPEAEARQLLAEAHAAVEPDGAPPAAEPESEAPTPDTRLPRAYGIPKDPEQRWPK